MDDVGATKESIALASESSPRATSLCCHGTEGGRNLVVNLDGTGNQFGDKNTNVVEMYSLLHKGKDSNQLSLYYSGIGTYARPSWASFSYYKQVTYHKIDLAIAWEFEKTIMGAYSWLSDNYQDGDRIFLLGFSRGAFQVRALSAMIDKVGLLYKGNNPQIPFAYELYADPLSGLDQANAVGTSGKNPQKMSKAERFKSAFCHKDVKVHFVGAWDTVSSIGLIRQKKLLPGTIDGMKHVCFFRHAMALDERRVKFLPEYAYGGTTLPPRHSDQLAQDSTEHNDYEVKEATPQCLEVWFAGTHSDIGGGNVQNEGMDRSRPPLRWMVHEAGALGLRMSPFTRELSSDEHIEIKESLTGLWRILEWFPFRRLKFNGKTGSETSKPHCGAGRVVQLGQKIHASLTLADKLGESDGYTPKARLSKPVLSDIKKLDANKDEDFWKGLGDERFRKWLEVDLEQYVEGLLRMYISERGAHKEQVLSTLKQIPTWNDGRQALYDSCIKLLRTTGDTKLETVTDQKPAQNLLDNDKIYLLLKTVEMLLPASRLHDVKLVRFADLRAKGIAALLKEEARKHDTTLFLRRFTAKTITTVFQATSIAISTAFSADGKWLASGHYDGTVQIWDLANGSQTGKVLGRHSSGDRVSSVAFSPDSKFVVSGSLDRTIRLWDVIKAEQAGDPWKGHTDEVNCVAFSLDGKMVVSASGDKTLRLWNTETAKEIGVLNGHERPVRSAAFSPDSLHVVSGSDDSTVRVWDACTYQQVGNSLQGHGNSVRSVAYSLDGKSIVSGSRDTTIRIWDAEEMKQVGEPLLGPSYEVHSVCFFPDGRKLLASGSDDHTIQIWDANTGATIGKGLRGDSDDLYVWNVALSSNGKQLASASSNKTIGIWDVESYVELSLNSIG
ncbi:hypothetical protein D9613_002376 [Agrocybe pediades]|uniref:T6SS Phospholipase effector Tle1-like catalytic domain-containing protein n=1 Tax=Agrocybe pediades TaxID=84607 RepID=A0A8H4R406_9AGAR|nr:hypothetical protein D9613_002376 [Agrocybe pediades]